MACRDSDGNLISADSAEKLGEYHLEKVPMEKVPFWISSTFPQHCGGKRSRELRKIWKFM